MINQLSRQLVTILLFVLVSAATTQVRGQEAPPKPTEDQAAQEYDRGYKEGFERGWQAALLALSNEGEHSIYDTALADGLAHFKQRRYGAAARGFLLAARNDQGDPISRLRGTHALVALGHYEDAYMLVRRAFQLQPNLTYITLDIGADYSDRRELVLHIERLEEEAVKAGKDARLWALLGYFRFFTNDFEKAHHALERSLRIAKKDTFVTTLAHAAKLSVPSTVAQGRSKPVPN